MTEAPANIAAEQALLGAVLLHPASLDRLGFLRPEHFADRVHADIFAACCERHAAGKHISAIAMKPVLGGHEGLKELGGIDYLGRLASAAVDTSSARDYGEQIVEFYARREIVWAAQAAISIAGKESAEGGASAALERLDDDLDALRGQTQQQGAAAKIGAAFSDAMARMLESREKGPGTPTGIAALDKAIGGLYGGDLTILAGRPGMGKSAVAINVAKRMAERERAVVIASREMSEEDIALRMASDALRLEGKKVAYSAMRRGFVTDDEAKAAIEASLRMERLPVDVLRPHVRRLPHILAEGRRIVRKLRAQEKEIGALIVDHIGLVEVQGALSENQRIGQITGALKGFAMEHDVPVIALSQLNRQVESRDDKRPRLSDLRDSGSVEQDADNVLFCYRPEYYLERARPEDENSQDFVAWEVKLEEAKNRLEIAVAKQRNGPTTTIRVGCDLAFNYLYDWDLLDGGGYG